ncbi:MAG: hypothetical protein ACPGEB_03115, partial [Schleiferiaceae bacterium]
MVDIVKRFMKAQHLLMQRNGGYSFIRANVLKLVASISVILLLLFLFDRYVIDLSAVAEWATSFFS